MKKIKKAFTLLTALVLCLVPLFTSGITAQAAEDPVTYYIKYLPDSNQWRFQTGGWSDTAVHRELYYMHQEIKDGSLIVIDDSGANTAINLTVNVKLSNLTIVSSNLSNITAKHVDNFYSIGSSKSIVNAPISNAYVYDYSLVNFNSPVDNLEMISSVEDNLHATIGAGSTIGHLKAYTPVKVYYDFYNFAANTLSIVDGTLKTEEKHYSKVPTEVVQTPSETTPAETTPATPPASSTDEYDDVPKTSDIRFNPLWLVIMATGCFTLSYKLRKEE